MEKMSIGWGAVSYCNMKCEFCYSKKERQKSIMQSYDAWVNFIDENAYLVESINYGTGESSLCEEWFDLIKYIRKNYPKIKQSLTTNGHVSKKMKENDKYYKAICKSIDEIDVSIDYAIPERHNQFRGNENAYYWAIDTLELCKRNNIKSTIVFLGTNDTMKKDNIDGLFSIAKSFDSQIRMNLYRPTLGINDKAKKFIPSYKTIIDTLEYIANKYKVISISDPLFCTLLCDDNTKIDPSGKKSVRILPDGFITPSTYLITDEFKKYHIREENVLDNIINSDSYFEEKELIPQECKSCKNLVGCKGGVLDRRYLWYSEFDKRDPYCPFREENFLPDFKITQERDEDFSSVHENYLPTMFFSYQS